MEALMEKLAQSGKTIEELMAELEKYAQRTGSF